MSDQSALEKQITKAVKTGDAALAKQILEQNPELIHLKEEDGTTLLHHAAWKGHAEIADLLLKLGAEVNAQNTNTHYGGTPLHAAAHGNQKAVVEILIANGADVSLESSNGRTPLAETKLHKATAAAKLLLASGAKE